MAFVVTIGQGVDYCILLELNVEEMTLLIVQLPALPSLLSSCSDPQKKATILYCASALGTSKM